MSQPLKLINSWWTWSGSNRRPPRLSRGAQTFQPLKSINSWWTWSGSNRRPPRQAGARRCFNLSNQSILGGPGRDRTDDLPGKPGRADVSTSQINQLLVDLVGIEPTTSPASRGAEMSQPLKLINSWWTWSGSNRRPPRQAGARRCLNLSNQSILGGPGRDRTDDLPGKPGRGASQPFKSINSWWTWSGSNRRPLPCHGSALPAAPQAHVRRDNSSIVAARWGTSQSRYFGDRDRTDDLPGKPGRADVSTSQIINSLWTWSGSNRRPPRQAGARRRLNLSNHQLFVDLVRTEPTTSPASRGALAGYCFESISIWIVR